MSSIGPLDRSRFGQEIVTVVKEKCKICLEIIDLKSIYSNEERIKLDCTHIFHRECIEMWSKLDLKCRHDPCPICCVQRLTEEGLPLLSYFLKRVRTNVLTRRELRSFKISNLSESDPTAPEARKVYLAVAQLPRFFRKKD